MEEFRTGLDRSVDRRGGSQGQVHLHPLSNIKSEHRDSTLSTGIYGTGTYVSVLE